MPKLRTLSGKAARAILEAHGFYFVRQKGSHMMMQIDTETGKITVPVPKHDELATGTLLSIIRLSGLPRELFES